MLLTELTQDSFSLLDLASKGVLSQLRERYPLVHLSVQTRIEGLPKDEMKLFITVEGETEYAIAKLGGSAVLVGWDIYLTDRTQSARQHLQRANEKMAAAMVPDADSAIQQALARGDVDAVARFLMQSMPRPHLDS